MAASFNPYHGEPKIQALQQARDEQVAELFDRPGAVIHARTFSSDDPAALGWDYLRRIMFEEGLIILRGATAATIENAKTKLGSFDPKLHVWDLFSADAETIRDVCGKIVDAALPEDLIRVGDEELTSQKAREIQIFLADEGVSPFSTDALLGKLFPSRLIALRKTEGKIVAAGFAAMTHNCHSPFYQSAWVGFIAVDPALRGLGLGKYTDALCNLAAVDELGAISTMEFVAQDNASSRAMLESCGLKQVEGRKVIMFSKSTNRITK